MEKLDRYFFSGYMILVFVFLFLPVTTIIIFSFNVDKFASLPWKGFTLDWYRRMVFDTTILEALKNSLIVSTCVAAAYDLSSCRSMDHSGFGHAGVSDQNTLGGIPVLGLDQPYRICRTLCHAHHQG
jgi:hypothetical protein